MLEVALRRSRFLVTYWEATTGGHVIYNYLTRASRHCSPLDAALLDAASRWTDPADLAAAASNWPARDAKAALEGLVRDGMLDRADRPPAADEAALANWGEWSPSAAFFHAVSSDVMGGAGDDLAQEEARLFSPRDYPSPVKRLSGAARVDLAPIRPSGELADVLIKRRTWRAFGDRALSQAEISSLLGLTFGVQRWLDIGEDRWVALKTSPSGGARHSIEAYLLAFAVEGLDCATYHYCPDTHSLTRLETETSRDLMRGFCPSQPGFHSPAALIVMTSVFERVQFKYQHPLAYRVVMLDAGHLGQTFALLATSLGLAPFCTAALDMRKVEAHLGIDGCGEAPVLALGVGPRPAGRDWAPMHDGSQAPRTRPPAWSERS